jgi:protein-S-isoprenylcysteine O-methyltransferase Ste14
MTLHYWLLVPALWIAWGIYWYAAAANVKAARRREPPLSRAAHLVPLIAAIYLMAARDSGEGWLFSKFLTRSMISFWGGVIVLATGLAFSIWARRYLGRNWSGIVTVKENHELIRTGPYRWVRHPIYSGLLVGFAGTAITVGEWRGIVATVLTAYAFLLKIRLEERLMIETFGDAYRRYRSEVKALIPFII